MTETAMTPMPMYVSHKEVWALKIKSVQFCGPNGEVLNPEESTSVIMHFEDPLFSPRQETTENRPKPQAGWYMVQYADGYISYSPGDKFEEGYTLRA